MTKSNERELVKIAKQKAVLRNEISNITAEINKTTTSLRESNDKKVTLSSKIDKLRHEYKQFGYKIDVSLKEKFNLLYEFDFIANEYELIKLSDLNDSNQKFSEILSNKINEFKPNLNNFLNIIKSTYPELFNLRNEILISVLKISKLNYQIEILNNSLGDLKNDSVKYNTKLSNLNEISKKITDFTNLKLITFANENNEDSGFETALSTPVQKPTDLSNKRKSLTHDTISSLKKQRTPNNAIWIGEPEDAFQASFIKFYYENTRNSMMSEYILNKTGKLFTNAQISDHISKLKKKGMLDVPTRAQSENFILDENFNPEEEPVNSVEPQQLPPLQQEPQQQELHPVGAPIVHQQIQSQQDLTPGQTTGESTNIPTPTGKLRWIGKLEEVFSESWKLYSVKPAHVRGSLISQHILAKTGLKITTKQISDHVRFLKLQNKLPLSEGSPSNNGTSITDSPDAASSFDDSNPELWTGGLEDHFKEAWSKYGGQAKSPIRNDLIAKHILDKSNISISTKQISDHIKNSLKKGSIVSPTAHSDALMDGAYDGITGDGNDDNEDDDDDDNDDDDEDEEVGEFNNGAKGLKSPISLEGVNGEWDEEMDTIVKEVLLKYPQDINNDDINQDTKHEKVKEISQQIIKKTGKVVSNEIIFKKLTEKNHSLDEQDIRYSKALKLDKYPPSNLWNYAMDKIILQIYDKFPKKGPNPNTKMSRMNLISDEILVNTGEYRTPQQVNKRVSTLRKRGEPDLLEILNQ